MTTSRRRLKPVEIALLVVPLCALAFAWWRMANAPKPVVPPRYMLTDLGTFGGGGYVLNLNDKGEINGVRKTITWNSPSQVFIWKNGKIKLFKTGIRVRIDNNGVAVGEFRPIKPKRLVKQRAKTFQQLPDPLALIKTNSKGDALLESDKITYLQSQGQRITVVVRNSGISGGAADINNKGIVIGNSWDDDNISEPWSWSWKNGTLSTLSPSNFKVFLARSINDQGVIVGLAETRDNGFAMLYLQDQVFNLNELIIDKTGWHLFNAIDINNRGQIVGEGTLNGKRRFFLLTPQTPQLTSATSSTR